MYTYMCMCLHVCVCLCMCMFVCLLFMRHGICVEVRQELVGIVPFLSLYVFMGLDLGHQAW